MVNRLTEVECLILCLLEGHGSYSEIYGEVMEVLTMFTSDNDFYCVKKGEFESWHKWRKDKAEIGGRQYDVEIWYYKKRLMIKFRTSCRDSPLDELIREAKKIREDVRNWKETRHLISKLTELRTIDMVYSYPLIEVGKRYHPDDFDEFAEESYTTFFYEIPDPFTRKAFSAFLQPSIDRVLVRLSRPSIISSRMTPKTRAKLVNVIYNSCLYEMRRRGETELSEESFVELRRFFENTFFGVQSAIAEMESTNILVFLSFLMALSAIAAILAILYGIPSILAPQQVMYLKSVISIFLLAVILVSICALSLRK